MKAVLCTHFVRRKSLNDIAMPQAYPGEALAYRRALNFFDTPIIAGKYQQSRRSILPAAEFAGIVESR